MAARVKKTTKNPAERFKGKAGPGRPKGLRNKTTSLLKDAILRAAELAGGPGGTVAYLQTQAIENPGPFMALMGKVLPMQLTGDAENPVSIRTIITGVPRAGDA